MSRLIDAFSFAHSNPEALAHAVGAGKVVRFALMPFVWVSLTRADATELPPDDVRFPAVVDTGCNSTLLISAEHLDLIGRPASSFPKLSVPSTSVSTVGGKVELVRRQAKLWLHPYPEGVSAPFVLESTWGITVREKPTAPANEANQQCQEMIPLLGARAFTLSRLVLHVDYGGLTTTIDAP